MVKPSTRQKKTRSQRNVVKKEKDRKAVAKETRRRSQALPLIATPDNALSRPTLLAPAVPEEGNNYTRQLSNERTSPEGSGILTDKVGEPPDGLEEEFSRGAQDPTGISYEIKESFKDIIRTGRIPGQRSQRGFSRRHK